MSILLRFWPFHHKNIVIIKDKTFCMRKMHHFVIFLQRNKANPMITFGINDFIGLFVSCYMDFLQRLIEKLDYLFFLFWELQIDGKLFMNFMVFRKYYCFLISIDPSDKLCFFIGLRYDISFEHLNPILMTKVITFAKLGIQKLCVTYIRLMISILYLSYLIN